MLEDKISSVLEGELSMFIPPTCRAHVYFGGEECDLKDTFELHGADDGTGLVLQRRYPQRLTVPVQYSRWFWWTLCFACWRALCWVPKLRSGPMPVHSSPPAPCLCNRPPVF